MVVDRTLLGLSGQVFSIENSQALSLTRVGDGGPTSTCLKLSLMSFERELLLSSSEVFQPIDKNLIINI